MLFKRGDRRAIAGVTEAVLTAPPAAAAKPAGAQPAGGARIRKHPVSMDLLVGFFVCG